jgi:flagellar basal-body rod protein FlgG
VEAVGTVVKQGYREASNVTLVNELVNMITVTRAYEANVKLVSKSSEATNSLLGVAMG